MTPTPDPTPETPKRRRIRRALLGRGGLSIAVVVALASAAAVTTQATFTDDVTMAQISVTGGTLDLKANGSDGAPGTPAAWVGDLSAAVTGLKPGDEKSGTVEISNAADVPFLLTASATGGGADEGCYSFVFEQTGGTDVPDMGTAPGSVATMVAFTSDPEDKPVAGPGADDEWVENDEIEYTLTVRMNDTCTTNGAAGTLDFTFNATQYDA